MTRMDRSARWKFCPVFLAGAPFSVPADFDRIPFLFSFLHAAAAIRHGTGDFCRNFFYRLQGKTGPAECIRMPEHFSGRKALRG